MKVLIDTKIVDEKEALEWLEAEWEKYKKNPTAKRM